MAVESPPNISSDQSLFDLYSKDLNQLETTPTDSNSTPEQLAESVLKLALQIVNNRRNSNIPFNDRIQEANLGVARAANSYDPSKGAKFSTYSQRVINNTISEAERRRIYKDPRISLEQIQDSSRELDANDRQDVASIITKFERENLIRQGIYKGLLEISPYKASILRAVHGFDGLPPKSMAEIGKEVGKTRAAISLTYNQALNELRQSPHIIPLKELL